MREDTKDTLTIWGLALVAILALGYGFNAFGEIGGSLILLLICVVGRRVILWHVDLEHFRHLEEERYQRERAQRTESGQQSDDEDDEFS